MPIACQTLHYVMLGPGSKSGSGSRSSDWFTSYNLLKPLSCPTLNVFLVLQIQLWRAELVTSITELSGSGQVLNSKEMALYPAGLLLGVPGSSMRGSHISKYLPTLTGYPTNALFTQNGLLGHAPFAPSKGQAAASGSKRSSSHKAETVGPVHHVRIQHQNDHAELQLTVQVRWNVWEDEISRVSAFKRKACH